MSSRVEIRERKDIPDYDWPLTAGHEAKAKLWMAGEFHFPRLWLRFIAPIFARVLVRRSLVQVTASPSEKKRE